MNGAGTWEKAVLDVRVRNELKKREEMLRKTNACRDWDVAVETGQGPKTLERCLHGDCGRLGIAGTVCVATKGKNRKENGHASEPESPRPQPEQPLDEGMSDEIVRDFLVESSVESQPAGKQPGRSRPRRRRHQF